MSIARLPAFIRLANMSSRSMMMVMLRALVQGDGFQVEGESTIDT